MAIPNTINFFNPNNPISNMTNNPKEQVKAIEQFRNEIDTLKATYNRILVNENDVSPVFTLNLYPDNRFLEKQGSERNHYIKSFEFTPAENKEIKEFEDENQDQFSNDLNISLTKEEAMKMLEKMIKERKMAVQLLINKIAVRGYEVL